MTEVKARKNPDFTASAINLTNPAEVEELLLDRLALEAEREGMEKIVEAALAELPAYQAVTDINRQLQQNYETLKLLIEQMGSYQDVENSLYGVAQRKVSYRYIPERVRAHFPPDLAHRVIIEDVDKEMVAKLVKGGLVSQSQADNCKVITKEETAFIIKV